MASEHGIAVIIKGFIPVDPRDLERQHKATGAVIEAQKGDLEALRGAGMRIEDFKATPVQRRPKAEAEGGEPEAAPAADAD